jgi:hypothetical protein
MAPNFMPPIKIVKSSFTPRPMRGYSPSAAIEENRDCGAWVKCQIVEIEFTAGMGASPACFPHNSGVYPRHTGFA